MSPVPEPETYAMLLAGLGLMVGFARRRKQQAFDSLEAPSCGRGLSLFRMNTVSATTLLFCLFPRAERRIEPFRLVTLAGLALLYLPTLWRLFNGLWRDEGQAHGPTDPGHCPVADLPRLGAAPGRRRIYLQACSGAAPARWVGGVVLLIGLALYVIGRSQSIEFIELGRRRWIWALGGLCWCFGRGRCVWPGFRCSSCCS